MEKVVSTQLGNSHNHFHQSFSHDNCDHYDSYYNCDHFHQIIVITDHNGTILNPLLGGWLAASQAALRHIHLMHRVWPDYYYYSPGECDLTLGHIHLHRLLFAHICIARIEASQQKKWNCDY